MNKSRLFIGIVIFLLLPQYHSYAENIHSFNGYYKLFTVVSGPLKLEDNEDSRFYGTVINRARFQYSHGISKRVSFNSAYTVSCLTQDKSSLFYQSSFADLNPSNKKYRVTDINAGLYGPENNIAFYQNLDRFFIKVNAGESDIYFGRQVIAWGSAKGINSTDIIAPFDLEELDNEERTGVDGIRMRLPTGELGELDMGFVSGEDMRPDENAFYVRNRMYINGSDIALTVIDFKENFLAGFDMSGSIAGAGYWFESAYVFSGLFNDYKKEENYLRTSLGFDYSFSGRIYALLEYHFSEAGSFEPGNYTSGSSRKPFTEGSVYLLGRHYLIPGVSFVITPLLSASITSFYNLSDRSAFASIALEYNVLQNTYFSAGVFSGFGKRIVTDDSGESVLRSEFGGYPGVYNCTIRMFF